MMQKFYFKGKPYSLIKRNLEYIERDKRIILLKDFLQRSLEEKDYKGADIALRLGAPTIDHPNSSIGSLWYAFNQRMPLEIILKILRYTDDIFIERKKESIIFNLILRNDISLLKNIFRKFHFSIEKIKSTIIVYEDKYYKKNNESLHLLKRYVRIYEFRKNI